MWPSFRCTLEFIPISTATGVPRSTGPYQLQEGLSGTDAGVFLGRLKVEPDHSAVELHAIRHAGSKSMVSDMLVQLLGSRYYKQCHCLIGALECTMQCKKNCALCSRCYTWQTVVGPHWVRDTAALHSVLTHAARDAGGWTLNRCSMNRITFGGGKYFLRSTKSA